MTPEKIEQEEKNFMESLQKKTNEKYTLRKMIEIDGGFRIYSIRPSYNSYYYPSMTDKKSICLHFTAGFIRSDVGALTKKDNHVSVSYVVDRSGQIYELFDDSYWSYHLGCNAVGGNTSISKQSIGVEISNYGYLKASGDDLLDMYGNAYCRIEESCYYDKVEYRGKSYFASMTEVQISATAALLKFLSRKHGISLKFKNDDALFASNREALDFRGIFAHSNVRKDKFDWPMSRSIKSVMEKCF